MNDFWIFIIISFLLFAGWFIRNCYEYGINTVPQNKGQRGEIFVVDALNRWATENELQATAYQYKTPRNQIQKIDVCFDSTRYHNIGIEVKFRNIQNLYYLKMEHVSRHHLDGNRQSSKQLYEYILPNNLLGLYAFVFDDSENTNLYFLPHYILEKMILSGKETIRIEEIKSHPNGYAWCNDNPLYYGDIMNHSNQTFSNYIETEFNNQTKFIFPSAN